MASAIQKLNDAVADSIVGRYFKIRERNSTFTTELRAGLVTFLATAYILAVNANILTDTGGTCICTPADCTGPMKGKFACVFPDVADPGYEKCLGDLKKSLITVTCAVSIIATFLTGVGANMPLALAPGMGLNAYFTYTVVGFRGTGNVKYKEALAAIFIEGFIFVALGLTGVRGRLIRLVPRNIMLATSAGIGLFLAHIGLQQSEGLGVIAFEPATLVTLGGCPLKDRVKMYTIADPSGAAICGAFNTTGKANLPPPSVNHACTTNKMRSATMWLGIAGGLLMVVLLARRIKGAVMVGILFVTFISWIHTDSNKATYLGGKSEVAGGAGRLTYFKKVVDTPDASKTAGKLDFGAFHKAELWVALITMLYVDFLDTTGTLYSMANFMSTTIPGFIDEATKEFPGMLMAFTIDGISISVCGLLGTSPTTAYIESATGIKEGGRTGMTALMISLCFFVALFFTPILASIPPYATGPALILVGALMMENIKNVEWHNPIKAVPAFLTMAVMPLTYSIAYGVIAGICSAIFLEAVTWVCDKIQGGPVIEEGALVKHADDN